MIPLFLSTSWVEIQGRPSIKSPVSASKWRLWIVSYFLQELLEVPLLAFPRPSYRKCNLETRGHARHHLRRHSLRMYGVRSSPRRDAPHVCSGDSLDSGVRSALYNVRSKGRVGVPGPTARLEDAAALCGPARPVTGLTAHTTFKYKALRYILFAFFSRLSLHPLPRCTHRLLRRRPAFRRQVRFLISGKCRSQSFPANDGCSALASASGGNLEGLPMHGVLLFAIYEQTVRLCLAISISYSSTRLGFHPYLLGCP